EIATALDRAHRAGIVHRDLKPANIMITKSGAKLLDFGIARLQSMPVTGPDAPTIAGPITTEGTILGTLQYMSPEQLEGKPTDERSALFALGCILYEMTTGKRAFDGASQASVITAIMSREPTPMSQLVAITPPVLERLVQTCLTKSPDDRWRSAGDLATELRWIGEASPTPAPTRRRASWLPWSVAALALVIAAGALVLSRRGGEPSPTLRAAIPAGVDSLATTTLYHDLSLSPDGRSLVFRGVKNGVTS